MANIGNEIESIAERDIVLTEYLTKITVHQLEQAVAFEKAVRIGETSSDNALLMDTEKKFEGLSKQAEEELKAAATLANKAQLAAHSEEAAKEFEHIHSVLQEMAQTHIEYDKHVHNAFTLLNDGRIDELHHTIESIEKEHQDLNNKLKELILSIEQFTLQATEKANQHEKNATTGLGIIFLISLVVGILLTVLILSNITRTLRQGIRTAERIAEGDLSEEVVVTSKDEVGRMLIALGTMRNSLHEVVSNIDSATNEIASASEELAVINQQSVQGIRQQQRETEQLATAINEMSATSQDVARNIASTADVAASAKHDADHGRQVVDKTLTDINHLAGIVGESAEAVHRLEEESDNIGKVLDVIRDIAEQTNLLALNAAIEAARAGEQGRGFAVVADEVRTLASRTQDSTQEIQDMISRLQHEATSTVSRMQSSQSSTQQAVEQATSAGDALEAIDKGITMISEMSTQIASAAEEQSAVAEELNRNVVSISAIADQTTSGAEQTSAASVQLSQLAAHLQGVVTRFKL